ncbi:hydrophobin-like protein [Dothistroma septosporum NZE10]|uniref:Hydrophobin-like protein n=1 Tax=Dothistroma septosporum (strain NZE10 / CBS 128990) TaxID=675120 RepID=N1PGE8_DOTSN|nr:hydrophobin-like protein [Dothistroma septosporum NZE10]
MQFAAFFFAGLAAISTATPIAGEEPGISGAGTYGPGQVSDGDAAGICTALYTPQCCETSVLGVADLACNTPSVSVDSEQSLINDCAKTGATAECCVLPVAGQALLCYDL